MQLETGIILATRRILQYVIAANAKVHIKWEFVLLMNFVVMFRELSEIVKLNRKNNENFGERSNSGNLSNFLFVLNFR